MYAYQHRHTGKHSRLSLVLFVYLAFVPTRTQTCAHTHMCTHTWFARPLTHSQMSALNDVQYYCKGLLWHPATLLLQQTTTATHYYCNTLLLQHTSTATHFYYVVMCYYGVATIRRLLKIIDLFCRISSVSQGSFAKETYNFKESTTRSHPIRWCVIMIHYSTPTNVYKYYGKLRLA